MYRQVVKKSRKAAMELLMVFGSVFLLFLCSMAANALARAYSVPYLQYAVYALAVVLAVLLYRSQLAYAYVYENQVLSFERGAGRRLKLMAVVEMRRILAFGAFGAFDGQFDAKQRPILYTPTFGKTQTAHVLYFRVYENLYKVVFHPSDELIDRIRKGIADADEEQRRERGGGEPLSL